MVKRYRQPSFGSSSSSAAGWDVSPGKRSLTDGLPPRQGGALPDGLRARFEQSLGTDLGGVRVHTDGAAAEDAASIDARAFAEGTDIYFGAGQYAPGTTEGDWLIAHEVAHTQQAAGGVHAKAETGVSSPGDACEVEADHAADAMLIGHPVRLGATSMGLMRSPTSAPAPATASPTAGVDAAIEKDFFLEMRIRAEGRMRSGLAMYLVAAENVKAEVKEKEAHPSFVETLFEMAVGMLGAGVANFVISKFVPEFSSVASTVIGKYVKDGDKAVSMYATADDFLKKLAVSDGAALAGYKLLIDTVKPKTVPGGVGPTAATDGPTPIGGAPAVGGKGLVKTGKLIDLFQNNFAVYVDQMAARLSSMNIDGVLGVYAAFDPKVVTKEVYAAQVRDLVKKHEEMNDYAKADGVGYNGADSKRIVMLDAWGVVRPAYIHRGNNVGHGGIGLESFEFDVHWVFDKWVEEGMASSAIAAGQAQPGGLTRAVVGQPYDGGGPIRGHIDNPKTEGQRIVEVNSWGRVRLCWAKVLDNPIAEFISWIPEAEEAFARVKGAQLGGIKRWEESQFKKIPPRPEEG